MLTVGSFVGTVDQVDEQTVESPPVQTPEPPASSGNPATEAALVTLLEDQIGFLKALAESERTRADRLQDELLELAKSHTALLERLAARRPWCAG